MDLQELLSLNQTIFGTQLPKIRALLGSTGITYDLTRTNAENIFFYFGDNVNVDVYVGGDNIVHVKNYCNLSDILTSISYSSNQVHIEFKLVYPRQYLVASSEGSEWALIKKSETLSKNWRDYFDANVLPTLLDVTDRVDYYSITGVIDSALRVYLLEYDQTKIMKL